MDNDELVKRAIQELALAVLYREYGKDMKNQYLIEALRDGRFDEFMARTSDERY
jgi:hypothetical protein